MTKSPLPFQQVLGQKLGEVEPHEVNTEEMSALF